MPKLLVALNNFLCQQNFRTNDLNNKYLLISKRKIEDTKPTGNATEGNLFHKLFKHGMRANYTTMPNNVPQAARSNWHFSAKIAVKHS